jgi:type I restriction enzyme R subunit
MTESELEQAALAWFEGLGYKILHGPGIAPGELFAEREKYEEPFLPRRLERRACPAPAVRFCRKFFPAKSG